MVIKTKYDWQKKWFKSGLEPFKMYDVHAGKEIRVFLMPGVDESVVKPITSGIRDLVDEIGLDLDINYYGSHYSVIEQVKECATGNGDVDFIKLGTMVGKESWRDPARGGTPHSDVIISDKLIHGGYHWWAGTMIYDAFIFFALSGERQNSLGFLRKLAKHETGHLLGLKDHHDKYPFYKSFRRGSLEVQLGYDDVSNCNMLFEASTSHTCEKCSDKIRFFWKGLQQSTGKQYFKPGFNPEFDDKKKFGRDYFLNKRDLKLLRRVGVEKFEKTKEYTKKCIIEHYELEKEYADFQIACLQNGCERDEKKEIGLGGAIYQGRNSLISDKKNLRTIDHVLTILRV